jgi:hypothetical protein
VTTAARTLVGTEVRHSGNRKKIDGAMSGPGKTGAECVQEAKMLAVTNMVRAIASFYPSPLREQIEEGLPALSLQTTRLALEVLAAETGGVSFLASVERPEFPLMARVHFGVVDLLQWRLPTNLRNAVHGIFQRTEQGDFEPLRRVLFVMARRKNDPEAALARFFLFQAVRLNLYLNTWNDPQYEAWGSLRCVERMTERIVRELLDVEEMFHPDLRPLHVLVKEALMHMEIDADRMRAALGENVRSLTEKMNLLTDGNRAVRALYAADAAVFRPGLTKEKLGSQRIADRYPHHFTSADAVDQRRSRLRKVLDPEQSPAPKGDRTIDVILDALAKTGTP